MVFTNTGRQITRNLLSGGSQAYLQYGAVGIGSAVASGTDTTLGSEVIRKAFEEVDDTTDYETTYETYLSSVQATGLSLREIGLCTASSGGSVAFRSTFTALAKTTGNEVLIEYKAKSEEG